MKNVRGRIFHLGALLLLVLTGYGFFGTAVAQYARERIADLVRQGFALLDQGTPTAAVQKFEVAAKLESGSPEILSYVGLAYFKSGDYKSAYESFEKARLLDPGIIDAAFLFYRASALRGLGLVNLEKLAWTDLIQWDEESHYAKLAKQALGEFRGKSMVIPKEIMNQGLKLFNQKPLLAMAYIRESLSSEKNDPSELVMLLGSTLNREGYYKQTLRLSQEYNVHPQYHSLWEFQRGLAFMGLLKWEKAIQAFDKIPGVSGLSAYAGFLKSICYMGVSKDQDAEKILEKLLHSDFRQVREGSRELLQTINSETDKGE